MEGDELSRRARDLVVDDAAAERARRGRRRAIADEVAGPVDVLVAAAERRLPVTVTLLGGQRLSFVPTAVGTDVAAGSLAGGPTDLVRVAAIAVLEAPADLRVDPDVDPPGPLLDDLLASIVDERPPVAIWTVDGAGPVTGDLVAAGDALVLADGPTGPRRHIPLAAVARLRLAP
ncbi:MAG: hypothetical protein AAGD18_26205 [Actinomycetota bacterium]